jgi:hypothetical protein
MTQSADSVSRPCGRCGHRFLDHSPNWTAKPPLSPCDNCDCPEFTEPPNGSSGAS